MSDLEPFDKDSLFYGCEKAFSETVQHLTQLYIRTLPAVDPPPATARRQAVTVDFNARIWSEAEAAGYCGYSAEMLARMRCEGVVPADLYRQQARAGKVKYLAKKFQNWFENCHR